MFASIITAFKRWVQNRRLVYIGYIEFETVIVDKQGAPVPGMRKYMTWLLFESVTGKRKVVKKGHTSKDEMSYGAVQTDSMVDAWRLGGPMPEKVIMSSTRNLNRHNLVTFPGGKK